MKLRGAISGFGEVAARAHLPGWCTRDNVNISAVHDPVAERRHEAIRLIKSVRVYDDLRLMLDGEAVDFVDIASPPALHARSIRAALEAGAHVLVEKPLCLDFGEFHRLKRLAVEKRRVLMCVHNWKYAPPYAAARRAIEQGRLGEVWSITIDRLRTEPAGAGGAGGKWRTSSASGGGILIDHGWHVFYLMHWLLGGATPFSISARLETPAGCEVDEVARVNILFENGVTAKSHLSWRASSRRTSAKILGALGLMVIEGDRVILSKMDGSTEDLSAPDVAADSYHPAWFGGVAEEFEQAVATGPDSIVARQNLAEAGAAIGMIAAARESATIGGEDVDMPKVT
ncbi:MAG: Gfo/Idh/MocA family oxidoreductase [Candidatus Binatus sp.]|uniref:Gfo/Idh/MocA family protein n=1 Tax=Candidatus Binatus sp. TaxID=2811406 RepID=UPI002716C66B|nr:Gfo/Idh/MocA family oxidoreductase [Candidatus Binatus sp.]MDO8430832.1 Gfo/Idh/MocA family oxidoreductase [Candidatus Binatus sp.]